MCKLVSYFSTNTLILHVIPLFIPYFTLLFHLILLIISGEKQVQTLALSLALSILCYTITVSTGTYTQYIIVSLPCLSVHQSLIVSLIAVLSHMEVKTDLTQQHSSVQVIEVQKAVGIYRQKCYQMGPNILLL